MGSDDLTKELPGAGPADRTTQPMIQELIVEVRAMREKMSGLESGFGEMREKMSAIESGFGEMRAKMSGMDLRFDSLDARLDGLETHVLSEISGLGRSMDELRDMMDGMNRRSLRIEGDVSRAHRRIDRLEETKAS